MKPGCPPTCDETAERAIVGCGILDPQHIPELRLDWFHDLRYRAAAEVLLDLAARGNCIDPATVARSMADRGIEQAVAITNDCVDACHSPANFPYWRDILIEKLLLRSVSATAARAQTRASGPDALQNPMGLLDDFEREVLAIRGHVTGDASLEIDKTKVLQELCDDYETAHRDGKPPGLATGFPRLDDTLGGLRPQQLVVVAARPSVGKTALALNIAEHVAIEDDLPVGFFSLEMSGKELLHRASCSRARVHSSTLTRGELSQALMPSVIVAQGALARAPLHICDRGELSLAQLASYSRRMVQKHQVKLLIVDYLGLLRSGERGRSRYEETTLISNGLKAIAKELNLPMVVLAQLNRDSDRDGRMPRLSDLRDSGAVEQDADIAILLHSTGKNVQDRRVVTAFVAKHRTGRTGKVDLLFKPEWTRFEEANHALPEL